MESRRATAAAAAHEDEDTLLAMELQEACATLRREEDQQLHARDAAHHDMDLPLPIDLDDEIDDLAADDIDTIDKNSSSSAAAAAAVGWPLIFRWTLSGALATLFVLFALVTIKGGGLAPQPDLELKAKGDAQDALMRRYAHENVGTAPATATTPVPPPTTPTTPTPDPLTPTAAATPVLQSATPTTPKATDQ